MSIQTEITRLQTAKGDMKTAIEGKGITVPSAALVDDYPEYISQIGGAVDLSHRDVFGKITVAQNTANSYVVKTAGTYKIPLVYGNGIKNSAVNSAAYTRQGSTYTADFVNHLGNTLTSPYIEANAGCTPASVGLLWQTTAGMITSVNLVDGFKCKYIQFTVASVPTTNGLAVLWVKDGNGNIMWSWTIWLCTDALGITKITNATNVEYDMLSLPFGAIWDTNKQYYVLPYCQWGRSVFLPPPANITTSSQMTVYDINGDAVSHVNANDATVAYGIQHPLTFCIRQSSYSNNWCSLSWMVNFLNAAKTDYNTSGDTQSTAIKTIYDPSPVGFMAPCGQVFSNVVRIGNFDYGAKLRRNTSDTEGVWVPAGGNIRSAQGVYYQVGEEGRFITYEYTAQNTILVLIINSSTTNAFGTDSSARGNFMWPTKELT